jgi:twinkle protein
LWRIESFTGGDLIITEGEMDALSFAEIGVFATSVPNGASQHIVKDDKNSKKFSYLWDAKDAIAAADRVIIAGDQDGEAGEVLIEELARRIGKAKCWRMSYPLDCKDANDVLVKHGAEGLKLVLKEATPWPVGGLRDAKDYRDEAVSIWKDGLSRGIDLDIGRVSEFYRPSPGTLTVCTGTPGSGKTAFLNYVAFTLANEQGWNAAVFSAETSSQVHLLQIASLRTGKSFRGDDKMSQAELEDAIDWASGKFVFLDESQTSIDSIIERAQAAVLRNGVRVLLVDPFNFITMEALDGESQHLGINNLLVRLKGFAVEHDVAVWLVAHPKKMYREGGEEPIPGGYDISGSASFFNVADNGITISRVPGEQNVTKLTSWKSRFPWLGSTGNCTIGFNPVDCSYHTKEEWGMDESDFDIDFGDDD